MSDQPKLQRRRGKGAEVPPRRPKSIPSTGAGVHTAADLPKAAPAPSARLSDSSSKRPRLSAEEEALVWPVRQMVAAMYGQGESLRWLEKSRGLKKDRARAVWDACMADLVDEWNVERPELLTRLLLQTSALGAAAAQAGNHSVALSSVQQMARLTKLM